MQQLELLSRIIRERRSVRPPLFTPGEKIPDEVIWQALENATWAPNHGKTEPWHFIVYTGEALTALSAFQAEMYKARSGDKFNEGKYSKLIDNYQRASHVIAICHKRPDSSRIPEIEEIAAVAAAVQNLALSIHAAGYGGYWTTGGVTYYEEAKPYFKLGAGDHLLGFYLAGVVAGPVAGAQRTPAREKTTWLG